MILVINILKIILKTLYLKVKMEYQQYSNPLCKQNQIPQILPQEIG